VADAASAYGTAEAVLAPVQENFEQVRQHFDIQVKDVEIRDQFTMLERWSMQTWRTLTPVFRLRQQSGFVRECHGDLHLRNIIYWRDTVIPFDCLEFSPDLRWIDVMCELAFLLMDLDDHRRPDLARRLLNAYLAITGDYAGLQVLRFYQVYRALVRAKVASFRLAQAPDPDAVEEISNYIRLASFYTQAHKGRLVITHGLSGSGKTFVSQQILEQAEVIHLRSDVERKRLFGLSMKDSSGSAEQQGIYHADASAQTYAHLLELAKDLVGWGYTVLVDAAFLQLRQRALFRDYAENGGIPFRILHCEAEVEIQRQRIVARGEEGDDASEADLAILQWQLDRQEALSDAERGQCISVDTSAEPELAEIVEWLNP
jgi:predicted kinase